MKYRSEIDGLRALAIVPVILFHAGLETFRGGFVGVDIFFVISGYLITTILLNDLRTGHFSLIRFYERRARRILPALFLVVLVSIPFAWLLLQPGDLVSYSKSIAAVSLFVSNIFFWRDGGYFWTAADLKPLLHTWSLAVEEQYYLLFPVWLLLLWKFARQSIFPLIAITSAISLVIAQAGSSVKPVPNFFLLPSRMWEFAIGSMAALRIVNAGAPGISPVLRQLLSACGLILSVLPVFAFGNATPFPSAYTLVPTMGAALIILFAGQDTYVGKLLSTRLLVGTGMISYSAYLWHQPVLAFSRVGAPLIGEIPTAALLALILALSVISWKLVETPFRKGNFLTRQSVFTGSVVTSAVLVAFGVWSSNIHLESYMARELASHVAIYSSNIDERQFVKQRLEMEIASPKVIVMGSSRATQIGAGKYGGRLLNLSVSGASVEDDLAIWKLVSAKFNPGVILIGADPWLFNARSRQDRWKSLEPEYRAAMADLGIDADGVPASHSIFGTGSSDALATAYRFINISRIAAADDMPDIRDKILRDGSRVYSDWFTRRTADEVEIGATSMVSYAMWPYEYSPASEQKFEKFVSRLSKKHQVVLVLSPYHPKLYEFMQAEDRKFIQIENQFRDLSAKLGVRIIGSYDPGRVGCVKSEFYDGLHPKDSCMEKVVRQINDTGPADTDGIALEASGL